MKTSAWSYYIADDSGKNFTGACGVTYNVRIEQLGPAGVPTGKAAVHEADDEAEAVTIAAYEVGVDRRGRPLIARVFDATGALVLSYTGRIAADERG